MKSNVATAVVAAAAEIGVAVYDFAIGEISAEEAGERIGLAHEGIHDCAHASSRKGQSESTADLRAWNESAFSLMTRL